MSSCEVNFKRNIKNNIQSLNKKLKEGIRFSSDGVDLSALLTRYKKAYSLIDAGDLSEVEDIVEKEKDVLFTAFRANMKEVFKGSFTKGKKVNTNADTDLRLVDVAVVPEGYGVTLETVTSGDKYKYTFGKGRNVSYTTKQGSRLYVPRIDVALSRAGSRLQDAVNKVSHEEYLREGRKAIDNIRSYLNGDIEELGSEAGGYKSKGVKKPDYIHGDIEHMKSVMDELHIKGKNKASDEHINYLNSLFDRMSPSFFREMDLFINSNKSDTRGWVGIDFSQGKAGKDYINVNMGKKKVFGKSEAEVYAHEVIHTMVAWALRSEGVVANKLKRELNYVMKVAKENTQWENLLGKPVEEANKYEIEQAKEMYDYMFNSDYADDEFIAHVLTNPNVIAHVMNINVKRKNEKADTLFGKAIDLFYAIVDTVFGNFNFGSRNESVLERVHSLAFQLAEINNEAEKDVHELNILERFNDMVNSVDEKIHDKVLDYFESKKDDIEGYKPLREDATQFEKTMFVFKFLGKTIFSPFHRDALGNYLSMWGLKPDSTIREIFGSLFTPDDTERAVEWASLKNANIDTLRSSTITISKDQIQKGFSRKLTSDEEVALTKVFLETNMSSLLYDGAAVKNTFSEKELSKMLKDEKELKDRIKKAKKKLSTVINNLGHKSEINWIQNQAHGLGYFMATGNGHKVQLTNAENIAIGYLSNQKRKKDENLVAAIREVATLVALDNNKQKDRDLVAELIDTEFDGVNNIAGMYEAFKNESERTLFKGDRMHIIDGYTKEIFDDTTDIQYAPISDREEMENAGYELVSVMKPAKGEVRTVELGMYVSDNYGKAERLRGAVNLGNNKARGVSLREIKYKESPTNGGLRFRNDFKRLNKEAVDLTKELYNSRSLNFDDIEMGIVPVLGIDGKTSDYRYMTMNKEAKAKRMGQTLEVTEVLSRSLGGLVDKQYRENQNKEALEIVKAMMTDEMWDGGDLGGETGLLEYSRIGPNVSDEKMKELYYMLPSSFKDYINSRDDKVIAVPTGLINPLFGYKHGQIGDLVPNGVMPSNVKRVVSKVLNMFEAYWIDLVKIVKGNILLKFPIVQITNILSNMFYMLNTGMNPIEIWRYHKESFRDVKDFMKKHKELTRLQLEIKTSRETLSRANDIEQEKREIKNKEERVARIQKELENSPVFELVEAGLYQSVVEDVETNQLNDTNKISNAGDKLLSKAPKLVRTGVQWAYLSKETAWYQVSQEFLQLSDLVARDVMNRKMKKVERDIISGKKEMPLEMRKELGGVQKGRELKGETKEKFLELSRTSRMNTLLDVFINYNKPNSKWEEWANRVGLVMFTKYIKRIQRIIAQVGSRHVLRTALLLAQAMLFINVDMIQDQQYLARAYGIDGEFSFGNIVPFYNPVDLFMNAATPAIVKEETFMGLI